MPDGRWVPTRVPVSDIWDIRRYGRQVASEKEALRQVRPPFAILPGIGIGPFRLGMTKREVNALCRKYGLPSDAPFHFGLNFTFENGRAIRIEFPAYLGLSLAGEPLIDLSNDNVRRLLASMAPPGPDWTEMDGLVVCHWDSKSEPVFSFMVYAPGHRV